MNDLASRLAHIDARILDAARSAGREASDITRIVVTKFHPATIIDELYQLGVRDIGENRQQELTSKFSAEPWPDDLVWHFIGQAQSNKARAIRAAASVVHSIDRPRIADAFDTAGAEGAPMLDVLIQVNLTDDPGRGGVAVEGVEALAGHTAGCSSLRVRGVMAVAPLGEEPARAFARLRDASDQVRAVVPDAAWISAGMTADFAEAIAAGATHLRIGSAITGQRPTHG